MKRGFTLIELLVVVAIVSILGSVVVASLRTAALKAQCEDGNRKACVELKKTSDKETRDTGDRFRNA